MCDVSLLLVEKRARGQGMMSEAEEVQDLIDSLHGFCMKVTAEREVSHGWQHMDNVRRNSMKIWDLEKANYEGNANIDADFVTKLIVAVAQLHDVADHKYGKTDEQLESVRCALSNHFTQKNVKLIQDIIDNISFSKEAKQRKRGVMPTWEELGEVGRIVRNICSDADKIEAIGLIGLQRCMQYSVELLRKEGLEDQINSVTLISQLIDHGHEKLFILMDEYIVTSGGKSLAKPSHDRMMAEVEKLQEFLNLQRATKLSTDDERQHLEGFEGGKILLDILSDAEEA